MIVIFRCTDPYIANRNLEPNDYTIVFEGNLKSCKRYLLHKYNQKCADSYGYASSQAEAVRKSKDTFDGMSPGGRRLDYDSRIWRIITKKDFKRWGKI